MDIFHIATELVANKLTALLGAVLIILVLSRYLIDSVKGRRAEEHERRAGMERRIRFLEEQALLSSETELECISINSSAIQLLSSAASGGARKAYNAAIKELDLRSVQLRNLVSHRHAALRERLTKPLVR